MSSRPLWSRNQVYRVRPCLIKPPVLAGRESTAGRGRLTSSLAWNRYSLPSCKLLGEKVQGELRTCLWHCQWCCELGILPTGLTWRTQPSRPD